MIDNTSGYYGKDDKAADDGKQDISFLFIHVIRR